MLYNFLIFLFLNINSFCFTVEMYNVQVSKRVRESVFFTGKSGETVLKSKQVFEERNSSRMRGGGE